MDMLVELGGSARRWTGWEDACPDEYSQTLRKEFEISVKRLNFSMPHEACVADMANLMQRLYAKLPPRNDGARPIAHILRVATKLAGKGGGRYGIRDSNIILAALAHDGVEDHAEALARLGDRTGGNDYIEALQYVSDTYGPEAASIVACTTHRKDPRIVLRSEKIADYKRYATGITHDPRALLVKIVDVCDNINYPSPEKMQRAYSMEKYWGVVPVLQEGVEKHKKYILDHGGHALYLRITLDLILARRRAAVWKRLKRKV